MMKRRDFIGAVGAIGAAVGLGSSGGVQETFLEKLKRLGCTISHYESTDSYVVQISHPCGFEVTAFSGSYRTSYEFFERRFDRLWAEHGPKPLDALAVYG